MNKLIELREIMLEHQKADQLVQGSVGGIVQSKPGLLLRLRNAH